MIYLILLSVSLIPTYLLRFNLWGIPGNPFELAVLLCLVLHCVLSYRFILPSLIRIIRPIFLPLTLISIGLALGLWVSPDVVSSLGIIKSWFLVPLALYYLLVYYLPLNQISSLVVALIVSATPLVATALWQIISGHFITPDGRASGWFISANYLAMYLVPVIILALGLYGELPKSFKPLLVFFILASLFVVFHSFSYGGWLGLLVGALAFSLMNIKGIWKWMAGGIVLVGGVILSQLRTERVQRMLDLHQSSSLVARLQVWSTDLLMIKEHPLTGIGLGSYESQYLNYASRLFSPPQETYMLHGHNLYLQFFIDTGVIGGIGFLSLAGLFIFKFIRRQTHWEQLTAASFLAILGHGLVDTTYFKNDLSALFWVVLALIYISQTPSHSPLSND